MRKLFWCCSAAGVLALGSLFTAAYYAYREPDSVVGLCITTTTNASVAVQPVSGLISMVARASHHLINPRETASVAGPNDECVPEDPKPVAAEPVEIVRVETRGWDVETEAPPIIIPEDDPMPPEHEQWIVPATIELSGLSNGADIVCPMVMPYCSDGDEQAANKPVMPYTEDDDKKPATASEDSEDSEFKEWSKFFEGADQADEKKDGPAEELPSPTEEPSAEPKCQEDSHIHEHYPGCPCTTCPYTGKSYPCTPAKKSGKEESSEEPVHHHRSLKHSGKDEDILPHPAGVDTMEYRPSDGALNEYGRGPL
ncbi:MAG TPA: hypothetical protein VH575_08185 [Gemmataceae bacterium]|jgi:hypothetical protein